MDGWFLWVKAVHILAVIAFMAGMLYLPRLFVYHAGAAKGSPESEIFKVMERRLEIAIMRPAFAVILISGPLLAWSRGWFDQPWLSAKLGLVALLTADYVYLVRLKKDFAADSNRHSPVFYRVLNEIGTLLLIGIVILVVVKPS